LVHNRLQQGNNAP